MIPTPQPPIRERTRVAFGVGKSSPQNHFILVIYWWKLVLTKYLFIIHRFNRLLVQHQIQLKKRGKTAFSVSGCCHIHISFEGHVRPK